MNEPRLRAIANNKDRVGESAAPARFSCEEGLDLVAEVYGKLIRPTETFGPNDVGLNLAFLLGAIANDGYVTWPADAEFVRLLRRDFHKAHAVWGFVELETFRLA